MCFGQRLLAAWEASLVVPVVIVASLFEGEEDEEEEKKESLNWRILIMRKTDAVIRS